MNDGRRRCCQALGLALMPVLPRAAWPQGAAVEGRLQAALRRLAAGEPLTVVAIGGSITTGYAADPPHAKGWAARVAAWLGERGRVRFVNAGVSGTDSAAAVQRVQAHVLQARPDLVLVEFGVNDEWLDARVRGSSYEGLLRQLLAAPRTASAPAVLALMLTQQGNRAREAGEQQRRLAAHYGITAIDFGAWMQARVEQRAASWEACYDEPVHPNTRGHAAIAEAVNDVLRATQAAAYIAPARPQPEPLIGRAHEFVRSWSGATLEPWRNRGFERGGPVHAEWAALPGGQPPGWTSRADEAEASFLVWGSEIAVWHAESEGFRNLEAWVDDGASVTLQGEVPERRGYLGWHYAVVGIDLEPGAHLLHMRMKRDRWAGSGRPAGLVAVMGAGLMPPALQPPGAFEPMPQAQGWRHVRPGDSRLAWVGRFERRDPAAPLMAWSGSELRARFTGTRLALRLAGTMGRNHFTVEIDGRRHPLALPAGDAQDWRLREPLAAGVHSLRLVKRSEGSMGEARLLGLLLDEGAELLPPPPPRPLRLEFYGDSITAGACNGDLGADQYDDLSTHDGTRAYGALVAERLGADYVGIALSGTGITRSWHELLMPQVWDRVAPRLDAPVAPVADPPPDVVIVNLGQNDHGFPASRGEPFAADFGARYLDFARVLRRRYPAARLVLALGGMSGWKEQPALRPAIAAAADALRAEGDRRVWNFIFEAFSYAHPRIDVHARMADELHAFLRDQVLR